MTVYRVDRIQRFVGLEDERPETTDIPIGSRMLEADTGDEYIFVGYYFASGVLTLTDQAEVGDAIDIGCATYTFISEPGDCDPAQEPGEIVIGDSIAETAMNIAAAINGTDGVNAPNDDVTAEVTGADEVTVTSRVHGADANAITTVYTPDACVASAFAEATLTGGYDEWQALP